MADNIGRVYLIGAGPGDPELITVKGLNYLKQADVIVYDRLVSPRLLENRKSTAECIYAGKKPDRHFLLQQDINSLLVEKAQKGLMVARLKGGDPFLFGRGGEEAEALVQNKIPFEIIPGVTSAIAVPAYAGIPVTHRDFTSSITIIAGNEEPTKEDSNISWPQIASGKGTLVFLMGMSNLRAITENLTRYGKDPLTPVALIRWGAGPNQQSLIGCLANIADKAREQSFANPAVIVVGEVVKLRDKLNWFEKKPLFGKKILVTRTREQASILSRAITAHGGEAIEFPTIAITMPEDNSPLDQAIKQITDYQWLIFTSVHGVRYFFTAFRRLAGDIRNLKGMRICAIGPQTRSALQEMGLQGIYVPTEFKAEALIPVLQDKLAPGDKVLLPRADIARKILPEALKAMGALVDEITAYRTIPAKANQERIKEKLTRGQIDMITFTSSSTVRNFVELLGEEKIMLLIGKTRIACIGPITAATAKELGLPVHIEAGEYTINGLVQAIIEYRTGEAK